MQTFFSTTFFNFNDNLAGRIYSPWLWLYFVVTTGLTLLVVVGTWLLWRKREQEVVATLTAPNGEQEPSAVESNQQPSGPEADQFVEQRSDHAVLRATVPGLRAISGWAQSNRWKMPNSKEGAGA
jgi:hypothetical protein